MPEICTAVLPIWVMQSSELTPEETYTPEELIWIYVTIDAVEWEKIVQFASSVQTLRDDATKKHLPEVKDVSSPLPSTLDSLTTPIS